MVLPIITAEEVDRQGAVPVTGITQLQPILAPEEPLLEEAVGGMERQAMIRQETLVGCRVVVVVAQEEIMVLY
jgi:hypothetical protein